MLEKVRLSPKDRREGLARTEFEAALGHHPSLAADLPANLVIRPVVKLGAALDELDASAPRDADIDLWWENHRRRVIAAAILLPLAGAGLWTGYAAHRDRPIAMTALGARPPADRSGEPPGLTAFVEPAAGVAPRLEPLCDDDQAVPSLTLDDSLFLNTIFTDPDGGPFHFAIMSGPNLATPACPPKIQPPKHDRARPLAATADGLPTAACYQSPGEPGGAACAVVNFKLDPLCRDGQAETSLWAYYVLAQRGRPIDVEALTATLRRDLDLPTRPDQSASSPLAAPRANMVAHYERWVGEHFPQRHARAFVTWRARPTGSCKTRNPAVK
jgi:hypothetical protein